MKTLRQRLTFTHTLVALIAIIIVALLVTSLIRRSFDEFTQQEIRRDAVQISEGLAQFYERQGNWERLPAFVGNRNGAERPIRLAPRRRVQIQDEQGNIIFDNAGPRVQRVLPQPPHSIEQPITVNGQAVGMVVLGGSLTDDRADSFLTQVERQFLGRVYISVIVGSIFACLVAIGTGTLITKSVTRPVSELTNAARRLASGEQPQPLKLPTETELAELAHSFNTMASELARQEEIRRQLIADIAHELRTPLSVLRLQVESLEDGVEQPTPDKLGMLGHEVLLLSRLVDDLRLLSLADAGQLSFNTQPLDPRIVLERAAATITSRAQQQQITIHIDAQNTLPSVRADPQRLAQVFGNLLENALRHTPKGGHITLRTHMEQQKSDQTDKTPQVTFEVTNTGTGIAPDELTQIFDRFYRADRARSRETGGSGLGLAIVQHLVEAQGGSVRASSNYGQSATFHVSLPIA
ncbi:MAG: Signal transduction histidine kinase involved in nitrogen fixation and metabolism regulation [Chloroflexi bacterium AL-W]|nr:Signal transduction histidine kinase involved in nitrogen fixation and metabolism regulation [Chloroflexi bacterium AL-N1]NOK70344.1 Signal transduction histidine kinase involved in nitrogen fixation and metabolism regulation [Chloroflexi bacterium AL-N10]NOK78022.1 Signal transduction histidine kinase involved in nitrogen fixation and metabolism regulation [Chloroflexi bacterium AL-N5]NOK85121.1 Signal transduction histidine kinase involved in nitrogen fixation and metabolism regulation [Chl